MKNMLDVRKFSLALGLTCAIGAFLLGIFAWIWGWGEGIVVLASSLYIGYKATFLGAIIGAIWGFIDGFIGGAIFAWIYNRI